MQQNNRKIALNTVVMYVRLIITTIIGLLSSRYVLLSLGASDYGLYAVVGGLVSMLNVLCVAMSTTTRRFINVEMGKPDGNMNRIFNISRLLHYGFALFILLLAESIGMLYIYNYLNVAPEKLSDAVFVFHLSTITAAISIVNIPYQALLQAFEKFNQVAIFDVILSLARLLFVISLFIMEGNLLRIYAIGMGGITIIDLLLYNVACKVQWAHIIKYKFYKDRKKYKEILFFNNYVALGASAYMCRTHGSNILVNYFFGTLVNAAFAIGYTVENFCMMFVSNIGSAANPQIAQNYANNNERAVFLTELLNKISIYLMLLIVVPLSLEMDFVLQLWLKDVPEGTVFICQLTLISALVRTMFGGMDKLIQASGKIRWFQIVGSLIEFSIIFISYFLYKIHYPVYTVIVVHIIMTIGSAIITYTMMHKILQFDIVKYVRNVLLPSSCVVMVLSIYAYMYNSFSVESNPFHTIIGLVFTFIVTIAIIILIGLNNYEKQLIYNLTIRRNSKK